MEGSRAWPSPSSTATTCTPRCAAELGPEADRRLIPRPQGYGFATLPGVRATPEALWFGGSTTKAQVAAVLAHLDSREHSSWRAAGRRPSRPSSATTSCCRTSGRRATSRSTTPSATAPACLRTQLVGAPRQRNAGHALGPHPQLPQPAHDGGAARLLLLQPHVRDPVACHRDHHQQLTRQGAARRYLGTARHELDLPRPRGCPLSARAPRDRLLLGQGGGRVQKRCAHGAHRAEGRRRRHLQRRRLCPVDQLPPPPGAAFPPQRAPRHPDAEGAQDDGSPRRPRHLYALRWSRTLYKGHVLYSHSDGLGAFGTQVY